MARHPVDIILILLRARLGQEVEPLTQADKSNLMDVIQLAGRHGVGPALHGGLHTMIEQGKADGWQSVAPMLRILADQNAVRNRQVRELCLRINTILRNADIHPVFVKGTAFILEDPEAAPWRFVSDVDVLVAPEQANKAFECLRDQGFSAPVDPSRYDDRLHHHLAPLVDGASGFAVELHTRLLQEHDTGILETTGIMAKARAVSLPEGGEASVLAPGDRALHAILHTQHSNRAFHMRNVEVKSLLDYAMLSGPGRFEEAAVMQAWSSSGFRHEICSFVQLASLLIGTAPAAAPLADHRAIAWSRQTAHEIYSPPTKLVKSARLANNYVMSFLKNPARILKILSNLKDSRFRADLAKTTQKRLGR